MATYPNLQRGDTGGEVSLLQSDLNKVGAMLRVDGDYGHATEKGIRYAQEFAGLPVTGVADAALRDWLNQQPPPFKELHTDGVAFIAKEETGGLHYYQLVARWPHYPGGASGLTIGVGYDLRFNSRENFLSTWSDYLPEATRTELLQDIGRKGSKARALELKDKGIEVPFSAAWRVFIADVLPRYYRTTENVYTSLARLPDFCRSVLVSLIFNRGDSLAGSTRREMAAIQEILVAADKPGLARERRRELLTGVEDQLLAMKRLWAPGSGLISRRQAEANLWRQGLSLWK